MMRCYWCLLLLAALLSVNAASFKKSKKLSKISSSESRKLEEECGQRPAYKGDKYKIFGGRVATVGMYPWAADIAAVVKTEDGTQMAFHTCGGTLISRRHVLTAGHCIHNQTCNEMLDTSGYKVYLGSLKATKGYPIGIKSMISHKRWGSGRGADKCFAGGDIAILELEEEVPETLIEEGLVGFGCLPTPVLEYGNRLLVAHGWGETLNPETKDLLMWARMVAMSKEECIRRKEGEPLPDDTICIAEVNSNVCAGDSGGPLLQKQGKKHVVIGVVSFGTPCKDMKVGLEDDLVEFPGGLFTDLRDYVGYVCKKTGVCYMFKD